MDMRELGNADFTSLHYFLMVAQYASFSRAAVATGVSQPTLSRQVRELEAELNVRLFDRTGRGVQLTSAGLRLLEGIRPGFEQLKEARRSVGSNGADGRLTLASIGVPPSIGNVLLQPLLIAAEKAFPALRLRVVEGFHRPLLDMLFQGQLDFSLMYAMVASEGIHVDPVLDETLFLVGAAKELQGLDAIPLKELGSFALSLPTRPHGLRELLENKANGHGVQLNIKYEFNTSRVLTLLPAKLGLACTILPVSAVQEEVAQGLLFAVPICDPVLSRPLVFAYPHNRAPSPGLWEFQQLVRSLCDALVQGGQWTGVVLRETRVPEDISRN